MNLTDLDIANMPAALTADEVADLFNIGKDHLYAEVRADRWPTPVLRIGRALRFPTAPILESLGLWPATPTEREDAHGSDPVSASNTVTSIAAKTKKKTP